jgi:hypothetical protein
VADTVLLLTVLYCHYKTNWVAKISLKGLILDVECITDGIGVTSRICFCGGHKDSQGLYSCCVRGFAPMRTGPNCGGGGDEIDRCYRAPSWSGLGVSFDSPVAHLLHPPFDTRTIGPSYFTSHLSSSRKVLDGLEPLSTIQCVFRESICTFNSLASLYMSCQCTVFSFFSPIVNISLRLL